VHSTVAHPRWGAPARIRPSAPDTQYDYDYRDSSYSGSLAGNIIAAAGALLILVGLILATANLVIWLTGRNKPRPLSDDEVLLRKIRDDGHRNRSS
jgi:hypothetical protein